MSLGHGNLQRRILEAVERYPDGFYIAALAGSLSENRSLIRAMRRLEDEGMITVNKFYMGMMHARGGLGGPRVVVVKAGTGCESDRRELETRYYEMQPDRLS